MSRFEKVRRIDVPVFFRHDLHNSIAEADFNSLDARLASEVLLHPVGSKISSHSFHAHLNVLNLRKRRRGAEWREQRE
jgi:hypothetical protein